MEVHPLKQYLTDTGQEPEVFASKQLQIYKKSIYRYFSGKAGMSREVRQRVHTATDGLVTAGAIADWEASNLSTSKT